jgi:hypothetical protein
MEILGWVKSQWLNLMIKVENLDLAIFVYFCLSAFFSKTWPTYLIPYFYRFSFNSPLLII